MNGLGLVIYSALLAWREGWERSHRRDPGHGMKAIGEASRALGTVAHRRRALWELARDGWVYRTDRRGQGERWHALKPGEAPPEDATRIPARPRALPGEGTRRRKSRAINPDSSSELA